MKTVRVPTLICLLFSLLLTISKQNSQLHFSRYNFSTIVAKPCFVTLFFMFHFIIITIFVGRPKPSVEDFEYPFSSLPPPSVYQMDKTIQKVEVCGSTSTDDENDDQSFSTFDGYDDNYHGSDGYVEDNDDDVNDTEGDQDSEGEEYDNELENKIEGFMAKVYQERREEFQRDRFLCITAG